MLRLLPILLLAVAVSAATLRLPVTADTNLSSYPSERPFNYGASSQVRLKGIEMFWLVRFDPAALAGQRVKAARFCFKPREHRLKTLGFSTVAADWTEGIGRAQPGGTCFSLRGLPDGSLAPWAAPGGDFTDVALTNGFTWCDYADVQPAADGWLQCEVAPRLLEAVGAGRSYGLCISDEKGQTRFNNDVYAREQSASAPYFLVDVEPAAEASIQLANLRLDPAPARATTTGGAARVTFELTTTADLATVPFALEVNGRPWPRWATPAPVAGPNTVWLESLPDGADAQVTVKAGSATATATGRASAARLAPALNPRPAPDSATKPTELFAVPGWCSVDPVSGAVRDGLAVGSNSVYREGSVTLSAARGEIVTLQVVVQGAARPETPQLSELEGAGGTLPVSPPQGVWYVQAGGPKAELAVPAAAANALAGQKYWPFLVELVVPAAAAPGDYTATWRVGGHDLPVRLHVWRHTLPSTLGFHVSLNSYGRVHGQHGIADGTSDAALAMELAYHRLAHRYRCTWQPLGYSHSGNTEWGAAPVIRPDGTLDFTDYDRRWGPVLDGTAFKGAPRDGVPAAYVYLPFSEHWPGPISAYDYHGTDRTWPGMLIEHALTAQPIATAFPASYQQRFRDTVAAFARHVLERGWSKTDFQGYLNDKYDYKDPAHGGRGTSWWWLDEPCHRDDWLALAFYGRLFREGRRAVPEARFVWRADISRPQWQRDWLDGTLDLAVYGNEYYRYQRRMSTWLGGQGARCWTYGSANDVGDPNAQTVAWCVRAWLGGADGVVPWNSVGTDQSFDKPDPTGLLVPGERVGVHGPVPSLRVLAFLAGQQECERLALLAAKRGWTREQTAAAVARLLDLTATDSRRGAEDAGVMRFERLRASDLELLRTCVARALEDEA